MDHIRARVEEIRKSYDFLRNGELPVDVLTFAELELKLEPILVPGLNEKFRIEAAIGFDFETLLVDHDQYLNIDQKRPWRHRRFMFSVAHELGHYFLHKDIPETGNYSSLESYHEWTQSYNGRMYTIEQEANEFAGALLVPPQRLTAMMEERISAYREQSGYNGPLTPAIREFFCDSAADRFQVNPAVISVRLDREGFWPAN